MAELLGFLCFVLGAALFYIKKIYGQHGPIGGWICLSSGLHGHVADGAEKVGKLDLVGHYQCGFHPVILHQRLCVHKFSIPGFSGPFGDGVCRMAAKDQEDIQ